MRVTSCCNCISLKTGTIIIGACSIVLEIISLIVIFTTNIEWKTIIINIADKNIVKIILAVNLVMTIILSLLLIIGAVKKNTYLMLPWVVLGLMVVISQFVSIIYTAIMFFIHGAVLNAVLFLIIGLITSTLYAYMWLVVYSYFQQVKSEKLNGRIDPYGRPYKYQHA